MTQELIHEYEEASSGRERRNWFGDVVKRASQGLSQQRLLDRAIILSAHEGLREGSPNNLSAICGNLLVRATNTERLHPGVSMSPVVLAAEVYGICGSLNDTGLVCIADKSRKTLLNLPQLVECTDEICSIIEKVDSLENLEPEDVDERGFSPFVAVQLGLLAGQGYVGGDTTGFARIEAVLH